MLKAGDTFFDSLPRQLEELIGSRGMLEERTIIRVESRKNMA